MTYSISARARLISVSRVLSESSDAVAVALSPAALAAPAGSGVTMPITRLQAARARAESRITQVKTRPQRGRGPDAECSLAVRMLLRGCLHEPPASVEVYRRCKRPQDSRRWQGAPWRALQEDSDRSANCIRRATQGRTEPCREPTGTNVVSSGGEGPTSLSSADAVRSRRRAGRRPTPGPAPRS